MISLYLRVLNLTLWNTELTLGAAVRAGDQPRGGGDHLGLLLKQCDVVTEEDDLLTDRDQVPHVADQHHGDEGLPAPSPEVNNYILPFGLLKQFNLEMVVVLDSCMQWSNGAYQTCLPDMTGAGCCPLRLGLASPLLRLQYLQDYHFHHS